MNGEILIVWERNMIGIELGDDVDLTDLLPSKDQIRPLDSILYQGRQNVKKIILIQRQQAMVHF
jgi:hypothetical protein